MPHRNVFAAEQGQLTLRGRSRGLHGGLRLFRTDARRLGTFVSFPRTAADFAELSRNKLTMPVLALGGEKANGTLLGEQMKLVAADVTTVVLKDTGHWLMEERPRETIEALAKFL